MTLFCVAIRRNSLSLLKFPILGQFQVFSWGIYFVYRLKYPYSWFFHFCFLVIFALFIFKLPALFLVTVISLSIPCVDALMLSSMLATLLPLSFLDKYSLSMSSLECWTLCIIISFLIFWSICFSSPFLHFKNGPEYFTMSTL